VQTSEVLILSMLFAGVVAAVLAIHSMLARNARLRNRLDKVLFRDSGFSGTVDAEQQTPLQRVAAPVAKIALSNPDEDISRFKAKFYNAGIRNRAAPMYFFAVKTLLAVALPMLLWFSMQIGGLAATLQAKLMMLLVAAGIGYYLPNLALGTLIARRQRELFEAFPDAIDLKIVCIEAGLSLDQAIQRTAKEMEIRSPALADELALIGIELRIGATRERALRNLATRTGVDEIQMFVAMLLQADRFGTSIADSMRVHADALRLRRQYRAEEAATKIPTKLLFPLLLTIFPALLLVLVGPAAIGLARSVMPLLSGGN
jgi:tight adherence protein C